MPRHFLQWALYFLQWALYLAVSLNVIQRFSIASFKAIAKKNWEALRAHIVGPISTSSKRSKSDLRCKVIEQMVKKSLPGRVPGPKKEPKWFQNLGRFKKNSSCSVAKKSPKNWTGPCLGLNMVRRKRFKWQTPSRNAISSFEGANPTPPSPMQQWRPPARTTIVSRTVEGLGSEGDKTVLLGPKNWNPISSSKCTVLARHG